MKVPVNYKGKHVGYYENGRVHFNNNEDANEVMDKFKNESLFISSRRIGHLKEDNTISDVKQISYDIWMIDDEVEKWNKNNNEHKITLTGINLTDSKLKEGPVYAPWVPVTTHVSVTDKNGTRTYRQVSRWTLFKLWLKGLFNGKKI